MRHISCEQTFEKIWHTLVKPSNKVHTRDNLCRKNTQVKALTAQHIKQLAEKIQLSLRVQ